LRAAPAERREDGKKKVKFSSAIDDDHEGDWQSQEIKRL